MGFISAFNQALNEVNFRVQQAMLATLGVGFTIFRARFTCLRLNAWSTTACLVFSAWFTTTCLGQSFNNLFNI
jgi:hypothetical protein